jgi:hypothetical protein
MSESVNGRMGQPAALVRLPGRDDGFRCVCNTL